MVEEISIKFGCFLSLVYIYIKQIKNMLLTILISAAISLVAFVIANRKAKQTEQPTIPTIEDEPLGYETSSLDAVIEREQLSIEPVVPEIVEEQPKPKAKKKTTAKPKAKTKAAPKKKKNA